MHYSNLTVTMAVTLALHGGWSVAQEVPPTAIGVCLEIRRREQGMPDDGPEFEAPAYVRAGQGVAQTPPQVEALMPRNSWPWDDQAAYDRRNADAAMSMMMHRNYALLTHLSQESARESKD